MKLQTKKDIYMVQFIPRYAIVPLAAMLIVNGIAYFGTRSFTDHLHHYDISGGIDQKLPFLQVFVIPYVLAYLQWIVGYVIAVQKSREYCYQITLGEIIAKLVSGCIFVIFPTTMARPEVLSQDLLSKMVDFIYKLDAPDNLFPSIHCLESWICLRIAFESGKTNMGYMVSMAGMSMLVFLSTVFIKQHVCADIFGGIVVAEFGLLCSRKILSIMAKE